MSRDCPKAKSESSESTSPAPSCIPPNWSDSAVCSLRELYLPGPIWNPGGANEDAAEVFKALATLKNVQKLHFGWHYSSQINVKDAEMQELLALAELTDLRCSQCRLTDISLAPLTKLRSLDLGYTTFSDKW